MMGMSEHEYATCIAEFLLSLYTNVTGTVEIFGDKCPAAFTKIDDIKIRQMQLISTCPLSGLYAIPMTSS